MSRDYIILIVPEPGEFQDIDGSAARVFMRFTEKPSDAYMAIVAKAYKGQRVYCLLGASTWNQVDQ